MPDLCTMTRSLYILATLLLIGADTVSAQQPIVITRNDMPNINDTLRISVSDNLLGIIDLNDTGEGHEWNYAALPSYSQRVEEFVDPVFGTPLAYNITFSNVFDMNYFATIAAPNVSGPQQFGFGPVQLEEIYDFFRETNGFFANIGMGATINNIPLTTKMEPRDMIYRFPLEYGATDGSFSQFGFDVPDFGHYGQKMLRTNAVDGWGTLTTRFGTFEVLRVYTELERTDTMSLQGFGFDQSRPKEFEVKWLGKNHGIPLLKVSGQFLFGQMVVNEVVYRDSVRGFTPPGPFEEEEEEEEEEPQSVHDGDVLRGLSAFPNPVMSDLTLDFSLRTSGTVTLNVMDVSGRRIVDGETRGFAAGPQRWAIDLSGVSPGVYLLSLTTAAGEVQIVRVMRTAP